MQSRTHTGPSRREADASELDVETVFREFATPSPEGERLGLTPSQRVKFSPTLQRIVRVGTLEEQKTSTYRLIQECVRSGETADAVALATVFEEEARICRDPFQHQIEGTRTFLAEHGMPREEIAEAERDILGKLTHPDGRPHESARMWEEFRSMIVEFARLCGGDDAAAALSQLDVLKEHWRRLHDRDCDHLAGLLDQVLKHHGEDAIRELWLKLEGWGFEWRYRQYDVSAQPWAEALGGLLYITFESGRGHLMGPDRTGDVEFEELEDCWVWRWDPCGSCGRLVRGDDVEGTPPRMESPYNWNVLEGQHPWTWGKAGVSPFGAHSCVKLGLISVDRLGYPLRYVDCPTYPHTKNAICSRYVYKDPGLVPEHVYELIGRKKPERFGSAHQPSQRTAD